MHTMMAFPGQVLMEYNQGERPVPYMPEFLECRNGKVWPNDRPGLGVSIDERQLTFVEAMTEGVPAHPSASRRVTHALVGIRSSLWSRCGGGVCTTNSRGQTDNLALITRSFWICAPAGVTRERG